MKEVDDRERSSLFFMYANLLVLNQSLTMTNMLQQGGRMLKIGQES